MRQWRALRRRFARSRNLALAGFIGVVSCAPLRPVPPAPDPSREPTVSVGVLVDTTQVEIGATTDYQIIGADGRVLHRLSAQEQAVVRVGDAGELVLRIGQRDTPVGTSLTARPSAGGMISIGGKPYRGTAAVRTSIAGGVTAINQVGMEDYLLGVVPFEIGRVGPELLEASKAQAVAARTYAFRYLGRRQSLGFDVFATVQDQVYGGAAGEHDPVSQAVRETRGEILTYQGQPIEAFYHSTCSGRTAAIEEVWPIEQPRPYLISVVDVNRSTGLAFDSTSSRFRWTQRWTADELLEILNRTLADSLPAGVSNVGELRDFEVLERTPSGRIRTLRISTSAGAFDVGRDLIRWVFLTPAGAILNSSRFEISTERDPQGNVQAVVANGMGWGHGIGMCQVGAMGRARAGQDYRTILETYYPGTSITPLY